MRRGSSPPAGERSPRRRSTSLPPREAQRRLPPPGAPDRRGRLAASPFAIPGPGWKDVARRLHRELAEDNLTLIAAGVAFYFMLSIFPGLIAVVSIWGLVAEPAEVARLMTQVFALLPPEAAMVVAEQLDDLTSSDASGLGFSALVSLAVALWSASKGAKALLAGLNVAYDESEKRGAVRLQATALAFTVGFVVFVTLSLALIAGLPALVARLPLGPAAQATSVGASWLALFALVLAALAVVYRYGPSRDQPRWRWVGIGSVAAATLWLAASAGFSFYASRFGSFNETYGALAGAVLMLLWLQITAFVVLFGAELNAETEHQTARDSTVGPPRPMGQRDAAMADTLGEAYGVEASGVRPAPPPAREPERALPETWRRTSAARGDSPAERR
jgi:membrane protein